MTLPTSIFLVDQNADRACILHNTHDGRQAMGEEFRYVQMSR